jgi:hypothetical protein
VPEAALPQLVAHEGEERRELREDEHFVAAVEEDGKLFEQGVEFRRRLAGALVVDESGMVTAC